MTRAEVEAQLDDFKNEQIMAYRTLKNKLKAGIPIVDRMGLAAEFIETKGATINLPMESTVEEVQAILAEFNSSEDTYQGDPLHIYTTSELAGGTCDDMVDEIYFYIHSRRLKSDETTIDFTLRNTKLVEIIRSIVRGPGADVGRFVYFSPRSTDNARFLNGEIEFDELIQNYRGGHSS